MGQVFGELSGPLLLVLAVTNMGSEPGVFRLQLLTLLLKFFVVTELLSAFLSLIGKFCLSVPEHLIKVDVLALESCVLLLVC